jgi:hypothetical protein
VTIRASPDRPPTDRHSNPSSSRTSVTIRPSLAAAPTERHSRASEQGERYGPIVSPLLRTDRHTPRRLRAQRTVTRRLLLGRPRRHGTPVTFRSCRGGGSGGRTLPPPGLAAAMLARALVVRLGRDARRSSADVRLPAAAQVQGVQPFVLDRLPGRRPAGHWRWLVGDAPSARAASLASSAALPAYQATRLARPSSGAATPTLIPTLFSTLIPTRASGVPYRPRSPASVQASAPSGGQSAARTAADWPPSGEWSGQAARSASRD